MMHLIKDQSRFQAFYTSYKDGQMYQYRAKQFLQEGLRPSVVFNVASIALECYLIALCGLYAIEPANHNYNSLMDSVELAIEVPQSLNEAVRSLDNIFGICSLEDYFYKIPTEEDMKGILRLCELVYQLFDQNRIQELCAAFLSDMA